MLKFLLSIPILIIVLILFSKYNEKQCINGVITEAKEQAQEIGSPLFAMPYKTIEWCKETF